jgi:hypothetical protein
MNIDGRPYFMPSAAAAVAKFDEEQVGREEYRQVGIGVERARPVA